MQTSRGWLAHIAANLGLGEEETPSRPLCPSEDTLERVRYIEWLVERYGPDAVGEWQDPPISIEEWRKRYAHRN